MNKKIIILSCLILLFTICIVLVLKNSKTEDNKNSDNMQMEENMKLYIKIDNKILTVALENNSSVNELVEKLKQEDITIEMSDYANFEKVGSLGFNLTRNDKNITTMPGDIILYQGNQITIYYDTNTWNFTKLGKIEDVSQKELIDILGDGDVVVTFSLNEN